MQCPRLGTTRKARLARALVLLLITLAAGCGFQPRGQLPASGSLPNPLYIGGISPITDLHREFRRQLGAAGVGLASSPTEGAAVLMIGEWDRNSRVLSVDSRNRAIEFELEERVRFTLRSPQGTERLPVQTERAVRIQYRPPTVVLGSEREAELLRADMVRDVVARILHRVAAAP